MSAYSLLPNSASDPDYIYYNANIVNNKISTAGQGTDPRARFSETRDVPILKDAHDYEVAVMKCKINGGGKTLPLFIPQIQIGPNINDTIYSVTLNLAYWDVSNNRVRYLQSSETFIQWVTELFSPFTKVPTTASPSQEETDYYYLYSYNHWCTLVNTALQTAYDNLKAQAIAKGYSVLTRCPTLEYDENTKLFSFYTDTLSTDWGLSQGPPFDVSGGMPQVYPTGPGEEWFFIGYNLNFEGLMTNFDTQYYGQGVEWTGAVSYFTGLQLYLPENTLVVRNKTGTNIQSMIDPTTGGPYSPALLNYVSTQDYPSTTTLWSPVQSIVLVTQFIPIRNEYTSATLALGDNNTGASIPGTSAFSTTLLDFNEEYSFAEDWRGEIFYTPTAEFIPVSLTPSHQEIKSVDFDVYWRNRLTNKLIPLTLYNSASIQVRLVFRRRNRK
jgi:hypothetical protein